MAKVVAIDEFCCDEAYRAMVAIDRVNFARSAKEHLFFARTATDAVRLIKEEFPQTTRFSFYVGVVERVVNEVYYARRL